MKKLLKLTKVTKEEVEIEVEFPIYRRHDISGDTDSVVIYTKIESDRREISIKKAERYGGQDTTEWEIEVDNRPYLDGENLDYALGKGEYASSEAQFNKVLEELRKFVGEL